MQQEILDRGKSEAAAADKLKPKKNMKPQSLILPSLTRWGTNATMPDGHQGSTSASCYGR